jgi:2-polyprenyl-3-methyl-5-hydroxy-6-metoxy-1,4-benzoquinol methylase
MDKIQSYQCNHVSKRFNDLLQSLDIEALPLEGYPKFYLSYLVQHKEHYTQLYSRVLQKLLKKTGKQPHDLMFIDYGTGNGLLAILASIAGFRKVIAIDADQSFLQAAQITAAALNFREIEFIHATEDSFDQKVIVQQPAVLAGTDVIEHIYNLELFFQKLKMLQPIEALLFTTASNPENPVITRKYKRMHQKEELEGGDADDRHLFGDAHPSFLSIRKKIIAAYQPQLSDEVLNELAKATRGLRRMDILKFVNDYKSTSTIVPAISHPTNTCDPETGSWAERMLELNEFEKLFAENDFQLQVNKGFYDGHKGNQLKQIAAALMNSFITYVPYLGIKLAPFIFLDGSRKL